MKQPAFKPLIVLGLVLMSSLGFSQSSFLIATLFNENVYKTKQTLVLKKVYDLDRDTAIIDTSKYLLKLNNGIPLRYKVVEEGDNPYIRLLPRLQFIKGPGDTTLITKANEANPMNDPFCYYFQMVDDPTPNNHYLATESIMGMPVTMPVKLRQLDGETKIEMDLSLGYAFGYKIRLNNNPYRKKYLNIIPFAFSLNKDSYVTKQADGEYSKEEESISLTYYSCGLAYEYYGLNWGLFVGWDRMFNAQKDWIYQHKSWISVGIGYKLGKSE